jgi:hypothetical protein
MDAELAATLALYGEDRAFPSSGTADAADGVDVDELLPRAAASARVHRHKAMQAAAAAAAGDSGGMYSAGGYINEDEMDFDVSPTMAAAAEALAGFADAEYRSSGNGSAGAHFFSPQKAGPMKSSYSPSKRMHFRKVMRVLTGDAEEVPGEDEGNETTQLFSGQYQTRPQSAPAHTRRTANKGAKLSVLGAADANSKQHQEAASAAAAALLAGSLVRQQHMYGGAAAAFDPAASVDGHIGQVPHILPQSQQQQFGITHSPQPKARGPAQLAAVAGQEQDHRRAKLTPRAKKHMGEDEEEWKPKPRPKVKAANGAKPSE